MDRGIAGTGTRDVTRKQPCPLRMRGVVLAEKGCESRFAATMR